jgi:hypothetical protein
MKTILAGTAFSISALVVWGFTLSRGTGEAKKESQPGIVHAERSAAPRHTVTADPRAPASRDRSSSTPRLSHNLRTESPIPTDPARPSKRPSISPMLPDTEGPGSSGDRRLPRAEREDISFATAHKQRRQQAASRLPLRSTPPLASQVPATTQATVDVDPSATPPSTASSLSSSEAADEGFRYRQLYGQHAWMARHIQMYNGVQEDQTDH